MVATGINQDQEEARAKQLIAAAKEAGVKLETTKKAPAKAAPEATTKPAAKKTATTAAKKPAATKTATKKPAAKAASTTAKKPATKK